MSKNTAVIRTSKTDQELISAIGDSTGNSSAKVIRWLIGLAAVADISGTIAEAQLKMEKSSNSKGTNQVTQ